MVKSTRIEQINCLIPNALLDETKFIAAKEIMERFSQALPCSFTR